MKNDTPINQKWLSKMLPEKKELVKTLFTVFLNDEPKRVQKIKEAFKNEDFQELKYLAHSLKGASATMGADTLSNACLNLEQSALNKDRVNIEKNISELDKQMDLVFHFMTSKLQEI